MNFYTTNASIGANVDPRVEGTTYNTQISVMVMNNKIYATITVEDSSDNDMLLISGIL